jgi:hypothetical protein
MLMSQPSVEGTTYTVQHGACWVCICSLKRSRTILNSCWTQQQWLQPWKGSTYLTSTQARMKPNTALMAAAAVAQENDTQ